MKKSILFIILSTIIISSCKHELETPSWDVELITPIANTNISIDKIIIEDSLIEIQSDDTGLVSLFFKNNLEVFPFDP